MQLADLFFEPEAHDPGGKSRFRFPPGMRGDAEFFGDRRQYRPLLRRWIGNIFPARFALFVGMNPSTADERVNDLTIVREWGFATRENLLGYAKVNIGDYRATYPTDLIGQVPVSPLNRETILRMASQASLIVMAHGDLPPPLRLEGEAVTEAMRRLGLTLYCLGKTKSGAPRHPSRLSANAPLIIY